jgi:hypothetical protein
LMYIHQHMQTHGHPRNIKNLVEVGERKNN